MTSYTREEVAQHKSNNSAWIVIGNKVYDLTQFLDEHPGGCEVLLEKAGDDGTEAFEDIGHSTDAREMKEQYCIGEIIEEERQLYSYDKRAAAAKATAAAGGDVSSGAGDKTAEYAVYAALFALIAAIVYYLLLSS